MNDRLQYIENVIRVSSNTCHEAATMINKVSVVVSLKLSETPVFGTDERATLGVKLRQIASRVHEIANGISSRPYYSAEDDQICSLALTHAEMSADDLPGVGDMLKLFAHEIGDKTATMAMVEAASLLRQAESWLREIRSAYSKLASSEAA